MTNDQIYHLPIWKTFVTHYHLNDIQQAQFIQYLSLLVEYSQLFNLTTITDPADIIAYHFIDSVVVSKFFDFNTIAMFADVGTGAGFPGIPLKILFPHLQCILLEVTKKKIEFLELVAGRLSLDKCSVRDIDWRTFLRKTDEPVDLFVARASLHPDELLRMFKPSSPYKTKTLIYWASQEWQPLAKQKPFIYREEGYTVKDKRRRLIFFAQR